VVSGCLRFLIRLLTLAVLLVIALSVLPNLSLSDLFQSFLDLPVAVKIGITLTITLTITLVIRIAVYAQVRIDALVATSVLPAQKQTIKCETKETPSTITWNAVRATIQLFVIFSISLTIFVAVVFSLGISDSVGLHGLDGLIGLVIECIQQLLDF